MARQIMEYYLHEIGFWRGALRRGGRGSYILFEGV